MESGSIEERECLLPNLKPRHRELLPTPCGPVKQCLELSWLEKIYVSAAILSLLTVLGANIASFVRQNKTETTDLGKEDVAISVIQLIGIVFCIYYVLRGVLQENQQELLAFILSILLLLVRSLVNFIATEPEEKKAIVIRFACIVAFGLFLMAASLCYLIKRPNFMAFRVGGALESVQSHYLTLNLGFSLVTFDLQAQLCLCVLLMAGAPQPSLLHAIILGVGIFWALFKAVIGLAAILKEKKPLVWVFLVQNLPELVYLGYLIYLISRVWIYERTYILEAGAVTGILISFTIKVGLLVSMVRVYHCFGQGLHERMFAVPGTCP
ncbi:uncharacterized protein LOC129711688 [Leucoraja erinacea]|uniref:uncharacterized protein LOC129711688 n=1 Tax=Leucoraja erinaceus TaxID=7782 RepID=UPI00245684DC|nr:uncharacterized protein LOC129711688 [Leucoraja erinacea]XP_055515512.1 uncharacterized protein LOC129711688 [Leucoraja erinacea]